MQSQIDARAYSTVLVTEINGVRAVHFCAHEKLSGSDCDLWFPLAADAELFGALEAIMCINRAAANVVSLEFLRENGPCKDYRIVYNRPDIRED